MNLPLRRFPNAPRVATAAAVTLAVAVLVAYAAQQPRANALQLRIAAEASHELLPPLPADLPAPVRRYFDYAFPDGARPIRVARFHNSGALRTDPSSPRWLACSAAQVATPLPRAFTWNARVAHGVLGVLDRYEDGHGAGRVIALGAITVGHADALPQLDAGALHRYLAEAVWYPSALWPGHGLVWTPIDAHRALATLTDGDQRVSLEFRFAPDGAVQSVHTPARWGRFDGGYRQVAWEGRFSGRLVAQGVRVPARGDVGWYVASEWRPVWRGRIDTIAFDVAD